MIDLHFMQKKTSKLFYKETEGRTSQHSCSAIGMQSGLCSQPMHSKAPGLRSSTCNWASHKSVHLHFALLQGGCGVKKSTDTTFLCREILLVCFTCLFPEELLPEEVSNSSLGCCVPFRRKLISPLKCSPSTARHMFSGHQPKEHSLQLLTYVPS